MIRSAAAAFAALMLLSGATKVRADDAVVRGAYLVRIIGCGDCHTLGYFFGRPDMTKALAGSDVGFASPDFGTRWPPNLTPDKETGLGTWTEEQIVTALRSGIRPDGRQLAPIMPYNDLASLTDQDAHAIAAYLKSLPPVRNAVQKPVPPGEKAPPPYMTIIMQ
jgi:mono/diheme cytochrome c family protein